jgi:hypothetical protein
VWGEVCVTLRQCQYRDPFIHSRLYSPLLCLRRFFTVVILHTVSMTPLTGDQPVARPLRTHRTAQTQNKRTHIHTSSGIRTHDPSVRALYLATTAIGQYWDYMVKLWYSCWTGKGMKGGGRDIIKVHFLEGTEEDHKNTAVVMRSSIFWDTPLRSQQKVNRRVRGTDYTALYPRRSNSSRKPCEDIHCPGRDSNRVPHKYEYKALQPRQPVRLKDRIIFL